MTWLYLLTGFIALEMLRRYALRRWGNYTLACLVFRRHEWCDQHLRCGCPHHDRLIMKEMSKT